ncbi:Rossmann-like and DUF2520 domain-containing protein [Sphaerobacter thermophilus]|uniref:NADP oxidoreductase coenzyme F420-dependent n=1 Tax=Sphaerobacter thermophilus (strain ATCC 49802 / DSM 20745 / KCCM 41009 / NCIMB 13125 / S 6022) TaxID=479434 RepID=D1C1L7_SPHTD|nr:DUF2520 domain-containing protein [Sphaerobacter thermophilus]ACZ38134.1 NADP oxidoreductase coenzyme F420-dependent [Sphaerobacter thermophilus DSM 20745]
MKVGFVGAGAAGGALARALAAAGVPVVAVTGKGPERAHTLAAAIPECAAVPTAQDVADRADLVVLAVPDRAIAEVCASVRWRADAAVVHCSGAHSLDVLEPARAAGALVGGCHPLQTLTGAPEDAARLAGSVFGIEAEEPLRGMLADLVERIGGRPVFLSARDKALYHASAVLISNYTVTLAATAAGLWEAFGVDRRDGLRALLPLLQGTVANLEQHGVPNALTGPIARGDAGTLERHLNVLADYRPDLLPLYRELGRHTVPLARERDPGGAADRMADALLALLDGCGEGGE